MNIKNSKLKPTSGGFTLLELLFYIAIFAIVAGMLSGILITFTRIQTQTSAESEVVQQLSFVQSTIQRLVRESVNISNPAGVESNSLTLKMASSTTVIYSDVNSIYIQQDDGPITPLTNDRVKVSEFKVTKYENPGAHAVVQVNLSLAYNSSSSFQQITRSLKTAIGRVTAAVYDDTLVPNSGDTYSIGTSGAPWKNVFVSAGNASFPSYTFGADNTSGLFLESTGVLGFTTDSIERLRIDTFGGSANKVMCWKSDGKTLGYCLSGIATSTGSCVCGP